MNRKGDKSLIVGLDIGTSKVTALVGEHSPGLPVEVIGVLSRRASGGPRRIRGPGGVIPEACGRLGGRPRGVQCARGRAGQPA